MEEFLKDMNAVSNLIVQTIEIIEAHIEDEFKRSTPESTYIIDYEHEALKNLSYALELMMVNKLDGFFVPNEDKERSDHGLGKSKYLTERNKTKNFTIEIVK